MSAVVIALTRCRYTYLLDLALQHNQPLLMVGPTGTGKSVYMNRHLVQGLPKEKWTPIFITMSARTTANMVQEQVRVWPPGWSVLHAAVSPHMGPTVAFCF